MDFALIIPARYKSSRFPGKPLLDLSGKSMIQRTWERCTEAVANEKIFVATDDERIEKHCTKIGIQVVMTSGSCLTGTDRVYEASCLVDADTYINVQGDEPLFNPKDIEIILDASKAQPQMIINGMCEISDERDYYSPHMPKVVTDLSGQLLYMSRGPIPSNKNHSFISAMRQVCIYAYPKATLQSFASYDGKSPLESQEDIEILRFLELGYQVLMKKMSQSSIPIDTPEDVSRVLDIINKTN